MKYSLQIHQVEVPVPAGVLTDADMERQIETFIERYEAIYGKGSAFAGAGVQAGVFRVNGRGEILTPGLPRLGPRAGRARRQPGGLLEPDGFRRTDVYDGAALDTGADLIGPAIIEMSVTTIVVQPGQSARVDDDGSFVITV